VVGRLVLSKKYDGLQLPPLNSGEPSGLVIDIPHEQFGDPVLLTFKLIC
jgi:hypothetical protein